MQHGIPNRGCGTGEHALFFAQEGHEVWGIDSAPWQFRRHKEG
jgi:hypothetical protein